ncbi:MAG: hypothetical protein ACHBN1_07570 [Heteroscytonema crispum UTEX LB 1556]
MLSAMLNVLETYLPPPVPFIPVASVSALTVAEKTIGLGNHRSIETRGGFAVVAVKGGRIDAVVRFYIWGSQLDEVNTALNKLRDRLESDREILRTLGFLRLGIAATSIAEFNSNLNAWVKTTDYKVLYEFSYEDSDGAESLITRIPIKINSEYGESTIVTGDIVRWDNEISPTLVVPGLSSIKGLAALSFIPGTAPNGSVTLKRTDGSPLAPITYPTLTEFLNAVTKPDAPTRHAQVIFATLSDFLSALPTAGASITLGDWNSDGIPDTYESRQLDFTAAIELASAGDRLEISYQNAALNQVAVIYLRVMG